MRSRLSKFSSRVSCVISGKREKNKIDFFFTQTVITINSTDSHAEFLFHEILHQIPAEQKSSVKLQCNICKKFFRKQSLREHLRQHTNERIFNCIINSCPMSFTRKANLKNHVRNVHKRNSTENAQITLFLCKICGKKFSNK